MKNFSTIALLGFSGLSYTSAIRVAALSELDATQNEWISGEVTSVEAFTYGKFIAKVKGDDANNTCTSFSTFFEATGNQTSSPLDPMHAFTHGEFTAAIKPSDNAGTVSTNIDIENNPWLETVDLTVADPQDDYNFYEIQWTPDFIAFLYNG